MRPSPPILQCLRPLCLLSRFLPHTIHNRAMYLARLLDQIDAVSIGLLQKYGDIRPSLQTVLLVRYMAFRVAFHTVFSHQIKDPEYFAESSNTPWNAPTIRCPDWTARAPQMSLLSLYVSLFRQSHLFLICVVLTYNDSRIIPRKTCQIPTNCQCK